MSSRARSIPIASQSSNSGCDGVRRSPEVARRVDDPAARNGSATRDSTITRAVSGFRGEAIQSASGSRVARVQAHRRRAESRAKLLKPPGAIFSLRLHRIAAMTGEGISRLGIEYPAYAVRGAVSIAILFSSSVRSASSFAPATRPPCCMVPRSFDPATARHSPSASRTSITYSAAVDRRTSPRDRAPRRCALLRPASETRVPPSPARRFRDPAPAVAVSAVVQMARVDASARRRNCPMMSISPSRRDVLPARIEYFQFVDARLASVIRRS